MTPRFIFAQDREHFLELCEDAKVDGAQAGIKTGQIQDYMKRRFCPLWIETEGILFINSQSVVKAVARASEGAGLQKIFIDRKTAVC